MIVKRFFLSGERQESAVEVEVTDSADIESLRNGIAAQYSIVQPAGKYSSPLVDPEHNS